MAQRSTLSSLARARSFFVHRLKLRIGVGQLRSRLAQPEAQPPEQALALPRSDGHTDLFLKERRERLPIPEVRRQAIVRWAPSQGGLDPLQLRSAQSTWAAGSLPVGKARQAVALEALHPVLHRPGRVAQKSPDVWAGQTVGNQKNAVQSVVVPGVRGAANLILEAQDHVL